jgi:hypothetical protein
VPDSDGRRSGESANDASDTDKSGTQRKQKSSTQYATKFGEDDAQGSREADTEAHGAEASNGGESDKAGARREGGKGCSGSVRAGAVQVVQGRVVGDRGTHSERARHALRMSVLPKIAPSAWSGARI